MEQATLFDRLFSLPWWWLAAWAVALLAAGFLLGWTGHIVAANMRRLRGQD